MALEQHAVQVEDLALEPAGDRVHAGHRGHRLVLVGGDADAQAVVLRHGQQVVADVEPLGPGRIVDPGNLHQLLIFEPVAKHGEDVRDALPRDVDRDLSDLVPGGEEGVADRRPDLVDQPFADALPIDTFDVVESGSREEIEARALPFKVVEEVLVKIEEPHMYNADDAVARVDSYIVSVSGAGRFIGERKLVRIEEVARAVAVASLLGGESENGVDGGANSEGMESQLESSASRSSRRGRRGGRGRARSTQSGKDE